MRKVTGVSAMIAVRFFGFLKETKSHRLIDRIRSRRKSSISLKTHTHTSKFSLTRVVGEKSHVGSAKGQEGTLC